MSIIGFRLNVHHLVQNVYATHRHKFNICKSKSSVTKMLLTTTYNQGLTLTLVNPANAAIRLVDFYM